MIGVLAVPVIEIFVPAVTELTLEGRSPTDRKPVPSAIYTILFVCSVDRPNSLTLGAKTVNVPSPP